MPLLFPSHLDITQKEGALRVLDDCGNKSAAVKRLVRLDVDTSLGNPSESDLGNVTKGIDGVHCCGLSGRV